MKLTKKLTILSFSLVLVLAFLVSSCSSKFTQADGQAESSINHKENSLITFSSSDVDIAQDVSPALPHLDSEINGLSLILTPYFDQNNALFVGDEDKIFLEDILLRTADAKQTLSVSDWERIIRLLFSFKEKDNLAVHTNISGYAEEGAIKRQYAVSGLMKLLVMRYPSLKLESSYENVKKSEIITDLSDIDDKVQILIRQAYCLGFTDFTVDSEKLFRPLDRLNSGEAISILYHTLTNLGLPSTEPADQQAAASAPSLLSSASKRVVTEEVFSLETIRKEYYTYLDTLKKLNSSNAKKRLNLLTLTESIIDINFENESIEEPLTIGQWRQVFQEIFGVETERIDPYLSVETNGILPYDVAAISIFKLSELYGGSETRDASAKELEKAREAIPQFDTARDTSKFAQMFSSGLLDGLYRIPGFTPQRPVTRAEALLLVKRMLEDI